MVPPLRTPAVIRARRIDEHLMRAAERLGFLFTTELHELARVIILALAEEEQERTRAASNGAETGADGPASAAMPSAHPNSAPPR